MNLARTIAAACVSALLSHAALAPAVHAQTPAPYTPQSGQAGKDVVWIPTPQSLVDRMMEMAQLTPADYLVDLGSGDGRTVITAAKLGVRAHGIEYNPDMVEFARQAAQKEGVTGKATFVQGDIFESDFSDATVVTMFLLPSLNMRLRPILLDMKPGTRIVSNSFDLGDWQADETVDAGAACENYCRAYKWTVPAKVGGTWRVDGGDLVLRQTFQMLEGKLGDVALSDARMDGATIRFTAGENRYEGRVEGDRIAGTRRSPQGEAPWSAAKAAP